MSGSPNPTRFDQVAEPASQGEKKTFFKNATQQKTFFCSWSLDRLSMPKSLELQHPCKGRVVFSPPICSENLTLFPLQGEIRRVMVCPKPTILKTRGPEGGLLCPLYPPNRQFTPASLPPQNKGSSPCIPYILVIPFILFFGVQYRKRDLQR